MDAVFLGSNTSRYAGVGRTHNAALRGEQRQPPYLNHCAVITKAESNRKCQALRIPLKRLVMYVLKGMTHLF
ncbi:hypothetical protein D8T27_22605 [Vibrio vulnificus]|nr:hypothetical protein D8T27_22605 [Vibrio vulnificus]